jgi:ATP-dependent DNA helicase DinG
MDAAAAAVAGRVGVPVITQRDLPKGALIQAFSSDESTCLFATAGFFQGVDIPGRTLSLVIIDRIPFPRPDDPLLSARRELLGPSAFGAIDLPRASILLAQAAGRLVRSGTDRGVVAVLDPRLATAGYRWRIVEALPPMRRTRHRAEAEEFLRDLARTEHDPVAGAD